MILTALILAYSFSPFDFSFHSNNLGYKLQEAIDNSFRDGLFDSAGHFILFFVFGALIWVVYERSFQCHGFSIFIMATALFCAGLEFSQLFFLTRHASLSDLVTNTFGVWAGGRSSILRRRLAVFEYCRRYVHRVPFAIFILSSMFWAFYGLWPMMGGLRMSWDTGYHLVFGNEIDGSRPWLGEIRYMGIYGRALTPEQVLAMYRNNYFKNKRKPVEGSELLVGWDFTQGNTDIISPIGFLRTDNLSIQVPAGVKWAGNGGGIVIDEPGKLVTGGPANGLAEKIMSSETFSVESWIRPLKDSQYGPARILSFSDGVWSRNFMLAQEGHGIVFRVRNGINGRNGSKYALRTDNGIRKELLHLVAVYDHGYSSLFLNGRHLKPYVDFREPATLMSLGTGSLAGAIGGILLILTVAMSGYSVFSLIDSHPLRHAVTMTWTFLLESLPYIISGSLNGPPLRLAPILSTGLAFLMVYPACFLYVHPPLTTNL